MAKFNKVELKKIDEKRPLKPDGREEFKKNTQMTTKGKSIQDDSIRFIDLNIGNISAIGGPLHGGHLNITYNQFGEETL